MRAEIFLKHHPTSVLRHEHETAVRDVRPCPSLGVDPTTSGIAICGFTTAGMVGVIATSHIIESLNLTQLGTVMNENFPAVALIQNEVPRHPVRVYQGDEIGVFTAEIQFDKEQDIAFGSTVLEWFSAEDFDQLIIIDGILKPEKQIQGEGLFAVGANEIARSRPQVVGPADDPAWRCFWHYRIPIERR